VYEANKELFGGKPVVNIDRHPNNARYGQMNVIDPQASSTAEVVSQFLSGIGVRLTADIATNVLNALYGATNAFQTEHVTAQVFELAAACLKAGGKRFWKPSAQEEEVPTAPVVEAPKPVAKPPETPPDWLKPKIYKSSNLL